MMYLRRIYDLITKEHNGLARELYCKKLFREDYQEELERIIEPPSAITDEEKAARAEDWFQWDFERMCDVLSWGTRPYQRWNFEHRQFNPAMQARLEQVFGNPPEHNYSLWQPVVEKTVCDVPFKSCFKNCSNNHDLGLPIS